MNGKACYDCPVRYSQSECTNPVPTHFYTLKQSQLRKTDFYLLRLQSIHTCWPITKCGYPKSMTKSFLWIVDVIISDRSMRCHSIIPQCYRSFFPSHANLKILAKGYVLHLRQIVSEFLTCQRRHTLNKSCNKASDSSSLRPMMRFVNPGLTKSAFWPVACPRVSI